MKSIGSIIAYQCPVHQKFVTLTTERGGSGTRHLGGKCCPDQYNTAIHTWKLDERQAQGLIESLENFIEYGPMDEDNLKGES